MLVSMFEWVPAKLRYLKIFPSLPLSTFFLSEGGAVVADTDSISGSHENIICLAAGQAT